MVDSPLHGSTCCCVAALSCLLFQLALIDAAPGSTAAGTYSSSYSMAAHRHRHQSYQGRNIDAAPEGLLLAANSEHSSTHTLCSYEPQWAQNKPQAVLQEQEPGQQQMNTSAVTEMVLKPGCSSNKERVSLRRHLLQPPPLVVPRHPPQITIQELLSAADVSADGNGSVQVSLPAVSAPNASSEGETQLPPVVVNLRISDLFPDQNGGKRRLQRELSGQDHADTTGLIQRSSSIGSPSSTAGSTGSAAASSRISSRISSIYHRDDAVHMSSPSTGAAVQFTNTASFARQIQARLGGKPDSLSLVARSRSSNRHALQTQTTSGDQGTSNDQGSAGQGLSGYLQDNPESAQPLQQLSGGRPPRLNSEQQPVTFCELFSSRCNPGKRMLQTPGSSPGPGLAGDAAGAVTEELPRSALQAGGAVAAVVARGRSLLQGLVSPAGLSTWLQTAGQDEQQMLQQILGRPQRSSSSSSDSTRISDVVGNSGAAGSPRRASRRMLSLKHATAVNSWQQDPATGTAAAGGARALLDLPGFAGWYSQASRNDQQDSQLLGINREAGGNSATIGSVVGGDASSRSGRNTGQGTDAQQSGDSDQGNRHRLRRLLQAASQRGPRSSPGHQQAAVQQQQSSRRAVQRDAAGPRVAGWKSAADPDEKQMLQKLGKNSDQLEIVPSVRLSDVRDQPTGRSTSTNSIANNQIGSSP